ncbi:hypothetical protein DC083_09965, partial [Ignatzschineria ureiclastica]
TVNNDGVKVGEGVVLGNIGLTIANGPSITTSGINAGGSKITNVAKGEDDTDAVNKGQLDDALQGIVANGNASLDFEGDTGTTKVNSGGTVSIVGGESDTTKLADGKNVGVVVDDEGKLNVKLAENLDLGTTGSVKTGNTTVNNDGVKVGDNVTLGDTGLTITNGPSITANGVDAGGKTITNVADGVNGKDAVNKDQLDALGTNLTNTGLTFAGNSGEVSKKLGDKVTIKGGLADNIDASDENLRVDVEGGNLVVKMAKNLSGLGDIQVGEAGKDGVDGKIGVTGKDGSSVVINGEDGSIGLTGPKGEAGKDAPTLNIAVKDGAPGLNGKDGEVRIVYKDKDGNEKEVASLDDGLLFGADNDGVVVERKLNQKLDILGGANNATD